MADIEIPLSDPVNGFKPSSWSAPVEDLVKEYEEHDRRQTDTGGMPQEVATREADRLVKAHRLDPKTGKEIPLSSKAQTILRFAPSETFKSNYEKMQWDTKPVGTLI